MSTEGSDIIITDRERITNVHLPLNDPLLLPPDTSKKRTKMRRVMSKNVKLLESTVTKYNTVATLSSASVAQIDLTDVSSGTFAWQAGSGMEIFSFSLTASFSTSFKLIGKVLCKRERTLLYPM